jgi:MFS family permease
MSKNISIATEQPASTAPLSMAEILRVSLVMRRMWYAQIISVFGDVLALFAVIGVLTFKLHATAQQVTGVQIAYLLPLAILGIVAGVFVDRWPLRPTLVASDLIRAALVLLLLAAAKLWHFYAILAAISAVSSFFVPAQGVAIRAAVPAHGLRSANALMQQVMFGMRIVGPAVAAFLVATFGPVSCYLLDSASFVGSALLIASLVLLKPASAANNRGGRPTLARVLTDMRQGVDFILHHAGLLFVILALASGMFLIGCFGPLIAVYVRDSLHASTTVFGWASALVGVGMLLGINSLTAFVRNVKSATLVYAGLAGIAAGLLLLGLAAHIATALVGNFVIGFAVAGIVIPSQTLLQQETPPELLGRVGSTVMSVIFVAQISGLVLSGMVASRVGVRKVFLACAVLVGIVIAVGRLWMEPKAAAASVA